MTGLSSYVTGLTDHLRQELGIEDPPTIEVMTMLGIPPAEWYRLLLKSARIYDLTCCQTNTPGFLDRGCTV